MRNCVTILPLLALSLVASSFTISDPSQQPSRNIEALLQLKDIRRTIDGSNNNPSHPDWGKSYTNLLRRTPARYEDGKSVPLENTPNARYLSQSVSALEDNIVIPNEFNLTMLWGTWGQFLDHDITLSEEGKEEPIEIMVPRCDQFFDKKCTGKEKLPYFRSKYDHTKPIRTNFNQLTVWIDASMVYGSTDEVGQKVREFKDGKLKTSSGDLLPIDNSGQFFAGDIRAIENMGLTTLQILFLREHNRLCEVIKKADPSLNDEEIFQTARNYVIGLVQHISMDHYLPNLFGKEQFDKYFGQKGYNASQNPTITTQFSSTTYRIGHPYIPSNYKAVDNDGRTIQKINLLELLVCNPKTLNYLRVNSILKGMAFTLAKQRTLDYVDELRNVPPEVMGKNFDLFAQNTDRNRDHGVTDYNTLREAWGLKRAETFEEIFDDEEDRLLIEKSYNTVDNIDTYIGVLGERKLPGSMFGELGAAIGGEQFRAIRNGDRLWYEWAYPAEMVAEIKATTLTDIINRNTEIKNMPKEGFFCHNCTVN